MLWSKPTNKQTERSDDSDSSLRRNRRSRSRERENSERRSRDRYDSSDRRYKTPSRSYDRSKVCNKNLDQDKRTRDRSESRSTDYTDQEKSKEKPRNRYDNYGGGDYRDNRKRGDNSNEKFDRSVQSSSPEGRERYGEKQSDKRYDKEWKNNEVSVRNDYQNRERQVYKSRNDQRMNNFEYNEIVNKRNQETDCDDSSSRISQDRDRGSRGRDQYFYDNSRKRKQSFDERRSSSEDGNVPEQYKTSNFTKKSV